jgi:hypothetical protein
MFIFEKAAGNKYIVKTNQTIRGKFLKDDDGYYYYWPEVKSEMCWDAFTMKTIAGKLDQLNKKWDQEINTNLISKIKI